MILCGPVCYRKDIQHLYLVGIDIDRQNGIDAFCTRNGKTISLQDEIAKQTLVEQHEDSPDKTHLFFYSPFKFPVKRPDNILGIEVKSSWDHGLMRVTPSITESDYPLKIIGVVKEPGVLNELQATELLQHINHICIDNGVEYLQKGNDTNNSSFLTPELKQVIKSLDVSFATKDKVKIPSGYRNATLISVADSILFNHIDKDRTNEQKLKDFFFAINSFLCDPEPLPNREVEAIWSSALKWAWPRILNDILHGTRKGVKEKEVKEKKEERQQKLADLRAALNSTYYFKTLKDTEEIWYYDKTRGVYDSNGDVVIKAELEHAFGDALTNNDVSEFLGHTQRSTYFDRFGFNPSIEWLACDNCMINLRTGQTAPISPDFLNTTYIPVKYSDVHATSSVSDFFRLVESRNFGPQNCQCPKIMKFLDDIVEPEDVELVLDFITYCLWRDYKYANWLLCVGYGHNGKSVLLNLIERFLGKHNTSSESLGRLLNERFAPASLYQKLANIDADMSGDILIKNTGIIKKLTGNDEYPGEFKYKTPFKFRNFAKLIFSCNEIPQTTDMTDAFFRRLVIVNFTQQFLAERDDPHILDKLCTEEEFSGLLNECLRRLPRVISEGIRPTTNETMRETYEKYMSGSNPVQYFSDKALTVIGATDKYVTKELMYDSYLTFCRAKKIAPESEQSFSRKLSAMGFRAERCRNKKDRFWAWKDVIIQDWKATEDKEQQTFTDLEEVS